MNWLRFRKLPVFQNKRNGQISLALPKEFKKALISKRFPKYLKEVKLKW